jgi:hypothetical protein
MAGIKVVAALVRCAADLLICDDIDTNRLRFTDAENCRNALPAIISELQRSGPRDEVVMGRCRFMVDNTPAPTASISEPQRRGGTDQAALGRCRVTDSGPAPTTDGTIAPPAPPAVVSEPQRRDAPDRCRITSDSGAAPTDSTPRAKPGIGVDVAAAGGPIALPAP